MMYSSRNTDLENFILPDIYQTFRQSRARCSKLINLINTNSLQQQVNEPTRQNNILDLVMTTNNLKIIQLKAMDKIGNHQMIDFALDVHDPNTKTQQKHAFDNKQANFELIKENLSSINYEDLMLNINAEKCY
ncbi:hypothetical protein FHG87_024753 [Trinorchestia longiramus]|nr:hypothetical protein FHG87_024753 [Trinorchestia longiramus]